MNQISIDIEEFVKNLKVTFFDISSQSQEVMNRIETYLSHEKDPQKVEDLQNLWALYHDTVKTFLSNVESISNALYTLESCNQSFNSFIAEKKQSLNEKKELDAQMNHSNEEESIVSIGNDVEMQENMEETSVPDSAEVDEVKDVEETPVPDSAEVDEVKDVEETPVPDSAEVAEVKDVEETPAPDNAEVAEVKDVEETPVPDSAEVDEVKDVEETPVPDNAEVDEVKDVEETPVSASPEVNEAKEEANTSDESIAVIEENSNHVEPVDEKISNETIVSMEETQANDKVEDNQVQDSNIVLPVIEEENFNTSVDAEATNTNETITNVSTAIPIIADIPSLSTAPEVVDNSVSDKMVFHKGMLVNDKAILVNVSQASNLRASIPNQKELFMQSISSLNEENVSAKQLEEMMNQLSVLYEQGKTKEAEEMSEKISVLNKKMTSAS